MPPFLCLESRNNGDRKKIDKQCPSRISYSVKVRAQLRYKKLIGVNCRS